MKETDQIKSKLDIVDLVGEYLQLKQAGSGSFKACCPFHQEKTPSFFVSRSKQIWHCFGCGEGGDQFEFVQKIEGMDFPEALQFLADKAGVELPKYDGEKSGYRKKLIEINILAAKFYHKVLLESQAAEIAREYLKKRNLSEDTVDNFLLGFAPEGWEVLLNFLKKKGYKEEDINQAGLITKKDRGSGYYDRFRNRLMFPITNIQGKVIGFTARLLDPEAKEAKYINTPQTKIYNKSDILFGLDKAKRAVQENDLLIIVEGNMDVITSHRVGVSNVVASSGTALNENQVNLIKRYTANVAFCFDADSAGQVAMKRGIDIALASGLNVSVIILKDAKDPDELINKDVELWKKAIDSRIGAMDYYFDTVKIKNDLKTAQGKKSASQELLPEIMKLPDKVEQSHWIGELARLVDVSEQVLRESMPQAKSEAPQDVKEEDRAPMAKSKNEQAWAKLVSILINRPELIPVVESSLHPEYIESESYQHVYKNIILYYNNARTLKPGDREEKDNFFQELDKFIRENTTDSEHELFQELALRGERDWRDVDNQELEKELKNISQMTEDLYKQNQKEILTKAMREAEARGDTAEVKSILQKFQQLD